jgi:hypothetical protein
MIKIYKTKMILKIENRYLVATLILKTIKLFRIETEVINMKLIQAIQ